MENSIPASVTTVAAFTRQELGCPKRDDRNWKRCGCGKYLYIYEGGRARTLSARTRAWEKAEKLAAVERARGEPANIELQAIKEREAQQATLLAELAAAEQEKHTTVATAIDARLASLKDKTPRTLDTYKRGGRRINTWAEDQGHR